MLAFELLDLLHPEDALRVRGHAPIAARGKADRTDLRAVRHGGALELLGEEAADERAQGGENRVVGVLSVKRGLGQWVELERGRAAVHHVIEEEIVQGIRAQGVLRALGQLARLGGDQLGGDRRIEDILHDRGDFAAELCARVADEMPDQRFGHRGAHVVHAHLVAVVGAPAQRQLAQIARAQREAADLVGDIHDDLRAFARLRIFVGDVVHFGVLPDIFEVLLDGLDDGDGSGRAPDQRHQPERVLQRAAARAHAGHGDADQPLHRIARAAERIGGGEQGERRIEAAAHAEHGAPGVHPLHAGQQGGGLNQQDFLRARVPLRTGGHEGQGRDGAQQALVGMRGQLKADGAQGLRRVFGKGAALAALEAQTLHVHIRDGEGALAGEALVFGEQAAVFVDPA